MASRRKRSGLKREASRSGSRSHSASLNAHSSLQPAAARRAMLLGLALESSAPSGSLRPTGKATPESNIRVRNDLYLGDSIILERLETMDLDDEETEEALECTPWHVRRWLETPNEAEATVCSSSDPLAPSISSTEALVGNVSGVVSVHTNNPSDAVDEPNNASVVDVCPSKSGLTSTSKRSARRKVCEGSELDSDFDDEFDKDAFQPGRLEWDILYDEELDENARNVIEAVEQAMDDEADHLLGVSTSYEWVEDFDLFRGIPEIFSGPKPGPIKDYDTPYDAFIDIWDKDIMERIAQETNRYANQVIDSQKATGTLKRSSRLHKWVHTDADELLVFIGVLMYMGIDPRILQTEYWVANDYLEMPKFKELLVYSRYILLNKFLHFVDNTDVSQRSQQSEGVAFSAKLAKIQPVISHLNQKFSSLYNLSKDISIGESLTGALSWAQTIRSKAARFGLKSYELCESQTGYLYKFQIYKGKGSSTSEDIVGLSEDFAGKSTTVVLDLLKDLEHRGHSVTMDNFYNCPALARYLKSLKFDCLGTLCTNRRNVPDDIKNIPKNMAKGEIIARHCGDVSVIAWKDSRVVTMISTHHNDETFVGRKAGKAHVKPVCVKDYNKTMGGVDLKNQKLSMYLLERKGCNKWYLKMFKRLLNVSIHNAYTLYVGSLKRQGKLMPTHREFRYSLAKSLVDRHRRREPMIHDKVGQLVRLSRDVLHQPKYEAGSSNRKRCVVCYKQGINKMVHSRCTTCNEFLCFDNCWRDWHSLPVIKGQDRGRKRRRNDK